MSYRRHWAAPKGLWSKGLWSLALAPVLALGLSGCGGEAPISSSDGGYRPAESTDADEESDPPEQADSAPVVAELTDDPEKPPVKPPSTPPLQPPTMASVELNEIPDGPAEIEAFLEKLTNFQPTAATQEEQMRQFADVQEVRAKAASKLLNKADATQEQMRMAIDTHLNALQTISQVYPDPETSDKIDNRMKAFFLDLTKHKSADIAAIGKSLQVRFDTVALQRDVMTAQNGAKAEVKPEQLQPLMDKLFVLLKTPDAEGHYMPAAQEMAATFQQFDQSSLAADVLLKTGQAYKDSKNEEVAEMAQQLILQAPFVRAEYQKKVSAAALGEEGADAELMKLVQQAAAIPNPPYAVLNMLADAANFLELAARYDIAEKIYQTIATTFKDIEDKDLAEEAMTVASKAETRLGMIGKPLEVEGALADGTPFDFAPYKGKVVLVDFWATWCNPCIQEMPNLKDAYNKWNEKGFEIIGINVNDLSSKQQAADFQSFMGYVKLPWTTVISPDEKQQGVGGHPMAVRCGVTKLPMVILIGTDGNVMSLHLRGNSLHKKLEELLGPPNPPAPVGFPEESGGPSIAPPANTPAAPEQPQPPAPAEDKQPAAEDKPAEDKPAEEKPVETAQEDDSASAEHQQLMQEILSGETYFTHFEEPPATEAEKPAEPAAEEPIDDSKIFEEFDKKEFNLYAPPASANTEDLVAYIFKAADKSPILRTREGFIDGVAEALQRVIDGEPKPHQLRAAAVTAFTILHDQACLGDEAADKHLMLFADKLKEVEDKRIASAVELYQLEDMAHKANEMEIAKIPEVLVKLRDYFEKEKLEQKHLRLASTTVGLINLLESEDPEESAELAELRESYFKLFGGMFAKSKFKRLAKYGKRISKDVTASSNDLVGKQIELTGATALGVEFNWAAYRGKVVVVDFWATWCGPCVRQTPMIKAAYEKYRDQGFEVVGVCCDDNPDALAPFIEKHKITWEHIVTPDAQAMASKYGIRGFPTMLLIDQEGKVVDSGHDINRFLKKTEELLKGEEDAKEGEAEKAAG